MGTNYYFLEKPVCECCKRPYEQTHIGKQSYGWAFSLRAVDGLPVETDYIAYWREKFAIEGSKITNEYGDAIEPDEMIMRLQSGSCSKSTTRMSDDELFLNGAEYRGDSKLLRHSLSSGFCVRNTDDCYDVIAAEFC